ncbi:MAG: extracellular solute-binding protein [Bacillota bacterium]|nr:MAG: extracellular solute-binding protein [Bacillota bacterium]
MRRRPLTTALTLLAAFAVPLSVMYASGCFGGPDTVIDEPVTISVLHSQKGVGADLLRQMAAEFSASHPNISVALEYGGDPSSVARRLREAVGAGEAPTLAEVPETALLGLRDAGVIQPLQNYIASRSYGLELEDLDDFWPCFVAPNTVGRQVWGMPFSHRVIALAYDPDLVPEPPRTWAELMEVAGVLTRRGPDPANSTFGVALQPGADLFTLLLYSNGGLLLAGDPPKYVFNSPAGTTALEYLYEIASLRKSVLLTTGSPARAVAEGRAAMAVGEVSWCENDPSREVMALAPLPDGGAPATMAPGTSLVITSGLSPAHGEAAWRFLRWLMRPENVARWSAATGDVPVRRSAMDEQVWRLGPGMSWNWRRIVGGLEAAAYPPVTPNWPRVKAEMTTAVSRYLLGEFGSSKTLLDGLVDSANRSLGGP